MANKGLKSYTKQIGGSVGVINYYVNVNTDDRNLILDIPVLESGGINPINLSLIYNHQNRAIRSKYGAGINTSYDYKLNEIDSNTINITNPDGSIDSYLYDSEKGYYYNKETNMKINQILSNYTLIDQYGNNMTYLNNSVYVMNYKNGHSVSYNNNNTTMVNNNIDKTITYSLQATTGNVNQINLYKNDSELMRGTLQINTSTNKLSGIIISNSEGVLEAYEFEFNSSYIRIYDQKRQYGVKFNINGDSVSSIYEEYYELYENDDGNFENIIVDSRMLYTVTYYNNKSKVEDYKGNEINTIYDTDGKILWEYDNQGNMVELKFNEANKIYLKGSPINLDRLNQEIVNMTLSGASTISLNNIESMGLDEYGFDNVYSFYQEGKLEFNYSPINNISESASVIFMIKPNSITNENNYLEILLEAYDDEGKVKYSRKELLRNKGIINHFRLYTISLTLYDKISSIKLTFDNKGEYSAYLSDIYFVNRELGMYYEYDSDNNLIKISGCKIDIDNEYEENLIKDQIGVLGEEYAYDYDDKGRVIKSSSIDGYTIERQYYDDNRVKKETLENAVKKTMVNEYTYDEENKTITSKIGLTKTSVYKYDNDEKEESTINTIKEGDKEVCLKREIEYNTNSTIKKLSIKDKDNSDVENISYEYENKELKNLSLSNGSRYSCMYDSKRRLTSVKLNDVELEGYTYDSKDNLLTKRIGLNNSYDMTYDEYNRLKEIRYQGNLRYKINYQNNRISSIVDVLNDNETKYDYDTKENLIRVYNNQQEMKYDYDDNKMVNKRYKNVKGYKSIEASDSIYKSKGLKSNRLNFYYLNNNECLGSSYNNDTRLKGRIGNERIEISSIDELEIDNETRAAIKTPGGRYIISNSYIENNKRGMFSCLVKPNRNHNYNYSILKISNSNNEGDEISLYGIASFTNMKLYIKAGDISKTIDVSEKVIYNKWNFICISFNENILELYINEYKQVIELENSFTFNERAYHVCMGQNIDLLGMIGYATCPLISRGIYYDEEKVKEYYELLNDIYNNVTINNITVTNLYNNEKFEFLNKIEVYPLNNSFEALNGSKESIKNLKATLNYNNNRVFRYNDIIKRYCYTCKGNEVIYNFPYLEDSEIDTCTISVNIFIENIKKEQCIFELYNDNSAIGLYINENGKIYCYNGVKNIELEKEIFNNSWYTVGISLLKSSNTMFAFIDEDIYSVGLNYNDNLITSKVILGIRHNENNRLPLIGQLESYCVLDHIIYESDEVLRLKSHLRILTKTNEYDDINRLKSTMVHYDGVNILSNTLTYNDEKEISYNVEKEEIKVNDTVFTTREYSNLNGNITNITDSVFGNKSYGYDNRGFLTNDNGVSITYDSNGNIQTYGTKIFTYDSNVKDKLIKVNNDTISYSFNNPLLPSSYKDMLFTYEGTRLTRITINYDNETTIYYDYYYNHQGLRVKKVETYEYTDDRDSVSTTTYYYYDGNKLITEYRNDNDRLDFLYDNNGLLYGFINNKTDKYYYVRDILQNILGIIDSNGNLIVKYDYNAYGELLSVTGTNISLGNRNPFRWKGYYYDKETGLFMVGHRYYNPEWGRWLSPDDVEYLEPDNINGLNLYCYCGNDPVNKYDPSGHFAISTFLISVGVGALVGLISTAVTDIIDDGKLFNGSQDFWDYFGNTLAGAIGGLAGGFGLHSMLAGIGFSALGDTVGGLISGDINSWESFGQTLALSVGMSILSAGVSGIFGDIVGNRQYSSIRNYSKNNNTVNKMLSKMSGSYKGLSKLKIGSNSKDDFLRALANTWDNTLASSIGGGIVTISIGSWF